MREPLAVSLLEAAPLIVERYGGGRAPGVARSPAGPPPVVGQPDRHARLGLGSRVRIPSPLQSVRSQTFSVAFWDLKKAGFRAVLRVRLGVPIPERYANSLSERRSLSGAWESSNLLYKLFLLSHPSLNDLHIDESW
jgi:hypothetical protein